MTQTFWVYFFLGLSINMNSIILPMYNFIIKATNDKRSCFGIWRVVHLSIQFWNNSFQFKQKHRLAQIWPIRPTLCWIEAWEIRVVISHSIPIWGSKVLSSQNSVPIMYLMLGTTTKVCTILVVRTTFLELVEVSTNNYACILASTFTYIRQMIIFGTLEPRPHMRYFKTTSTF